MDGAIITTINGAPSDHLSIYDRGLHYGDGVFETMLFQHGRISLYSLHQARLERSLRALKINISSELIERDLAEHCQKVLALGVENVIIKLIVTRGSSARGYNPLLADKPSLLLFAFPPQPNTELAQHGADVTVCKTRLSEQPLLAGIKHLNRLENVLARSEWESEFQEGLMLCQRGNLVEGTMSNVFFIEKKTIVTPSINSCGVAGVIRRCIIEKLAPGLGISVVEKEIPESAITSMSSGFLTNSLIGIWPIKTLQGKSLQISPFTRQLQEALDGYREKS